MEGTENLREVRVWDAPTRLFHWLLALLVCVSFATGKLGGNVMKWHLYSGYGILALLGFRLAWGFAGGTDARFSHFLRGPGAILDYARLLFRRAPSHIPGHNPLGGIMVVVMLLALTLQAASGLFSNDDIATEGPLAARIGKDLSDRITGIHKANSTGVLALVILHLGAILFYLAYKGENLVSPMLTGVKRIPGPWVSGPAVFPSPFRALAIAALSVVGVYLLLGS